MHPLLIVLLVIFSATALSILIWYYLTFRPVKTGLIFNNQQNITMYALKDSMVNSYVIQTPNTTVMIDTGIGPHTVKALKSLGVTPDSVKHVFLTHSDYDHVGNVSAFPNAKIHLHQKETALITGKTARFGSKKYNTILRQDFITFANDTPIIVEDIVIQPIFTPGHTLGHTCYIINECVLFTGDTLRLLPNGGIIPFMLFINMNNTQQRESIARIKKILVDHPIQFMATGHSGLRRF
ncbi:MAG: hypothetical protein DRO88_04505 [Promethearchaeia archaeon]|nr:MAG: hypothetical protein DRO88_04505 [Candidatus Lokiarchaeia archaeon]